MIKIWLFRALMPLCRLLHPILKINSIKRKKKLFPTFLSLPNRLLSVWYLFFISDFLFYKASGKSVIINNLFSTSKIDYIFLLIPVCVHFFLLIRLVFKLKFDIKLIIF
jgi:hypothetical protein